MPFSASLAGAPAEVHQHVLIQNIILFQPCASSGSAKMAPLKSVPHSYCWWGTMLPLSFKGHHVAGGDPKMLPSHGCAKPYRSAVSWHEGMCEHRPQNMTPVGKTMPYLEPRWLLGKALVVRLSAELWGAPGNKFDACCPLYPSHMWNRSNSLCVSTIIYTQEPLGIMWLMPSSKLARRLFESLLSLDHGYGLTLDTW